MVQEASLQGIVKIIFWFFAIAFIIRLVARMALPYVVKKGEQAMRDRMQQMQDQQRPQRNEGEVTIEKNASAHTSKGSGDYVDYVEIKD